MSLQQKLRAFAQLELGGVIPWDSFKFPDVTNSDTTRCVIEGRNGEYRITVTSPYSKPPLGEVVFVDGDFELTEANQDQAWHRIAERLKARERGEEVAVAAPEPAKPVIVPISHNPLAIPDRTFVYYWAEPGAWYQNGPALVTRQNRDGSYNLVVFPEGSEPVHREKVAQRSERLQNVCWEAYPASAEDAASVRGELDEFRLRTANEIDALQMELKELREKRGPGRPPSASKVA